MRLHEPSEPGTDQTVVRLKHDVTQVFQSMLAAIQVLQDHAAVSDERDKRIDDRFGKLYTAAVGVLLSLVTASLLLAANVVLLRDVAGSG